MAIYNGWTVEYLKGSTWTAIPNVQNLTCQVGRRSAVEQWPVSSATIRVWYPDGWTSPLEQFAIGTAIRFFAPGRSATKPSWTGLVRDATFEVGIPWNSATGDANADFLTIECEGHYADVGRMANYGSPQPVLASAPGSVERLKNYLSNVAIRSQTIQTSPYKTQFFFWCGDPSSPSNYFFLPIGPLVTEFLALTNYRLCDGVRVPSGTGADLPMIYFGGPTGASTVATVGFSDVANNSTNRVFDDLVFDGLADRYYTRAALNYSVGGTPTTMTRSVGDAPYRTYETSVPSSTAVSPYYLEDTYIAQAEYLANTYTPAEIGVGVISATTAAQQTQNLDTLGVADLELGYLPLYVVPVTVRGDTFYCQIEGVTVTADLDQSRFTYYVTPATTTGWFILDSTALGVLDENRLGVF